MNPNTQITRDDRVFIVLNARSGRTAANERIATIETVLRAAGQPHEIIAVEQARQVAHAARRAVEQARRRQGVVVAAGGDGTINSVAQVVLQSGLRFGVMPQGTFNYFGRTHGIPSDTEEATRALLRSTLRPVQVGLLNDRIFLVNASVGLYPELLEDREFYKKQFGRSRLVALWAGLRTILREHRQLVLELEHEGGTRMMRTSTLVAGNNRLQLEQIGIADAGAVRDGLLVAIIVRPVTKIAMLGLLIRGATGQMGAAENVISFAFKSLTVRLRRPFGRRRIKIATDGEVARLHLPLVFKVAPEPLWLLAPPTHEPQA